MRRMEREQHQREKLKLEKAIKQAAVCLSCVLHRGLLHYDAKKFIDKHGYAYLQQDDAKSALNWLCSVGADVDDEVKNLINGYGPFKSDTKPAKLSLTVSSTNNEGSWERPGGFLK
jgi:hypothetical protein